MDAASSSPDSRVLYDVFLSFKGEDCRMGFVSHLCKALDQKGIITFNDLKVERGSAISSQVFTGINESRVSIVIFTQNYASSTWCMKELVQILECMDRKNQIVVPVFYDIDPSDARKFKKSFAEAFAKHEKYFGDVEEVQNWKSALARATNISGWDSRKYSNDAELILEITQDISNKLIPTLSSKTYGLVGMDSHMDKMNSLLCAGVDDIKVVGIFGMGGIGKTTIARAVYDAIACQFAACGFLENVREGFTKKGAIHMQEVLLSKISVEEVPKFSTLSRGSKMIMERLNNKRSLLVLDDVNDIDQIETLIGRHRSFGHGSRIMITSRDEHLLTRSGVDAMYKAKPLGYYGALELFGEYAFKTNQSTREPIEDYHHLPSRIIEYAHGLPLALKVLGAFLDNKSVREWEDVLEKMKKFPPGEIQYVLRTSFEALNESEKKIFLDIACFFKGMNKDYATKVLDSCGFSPRTGLNVLVDRALVTISNDTLEMHDLLQEMAFEIVRQECINDPGRRTRLWHKEDVLLVLTQNKATEAIESITGNLSNSEEVFLNPEAFDKMENLRLLNIKSNVKAIQLLSHEDFKFPSHKLSSMLWHGCPLRALPSNFCSKNLVDLDMQYSLIEQLWEGTKPLKKLEFINLSHSQYLKKTPDFTEATNLEKLILDGCTCLFEVHPSIAFLENLVLLSLKGCKELKLFSRHICMKSLKTLDLSGCSNLEEFPEILDVMEKLSELYLGGTSIKELPPSIEKLTGLVTLSMEGCRELERLPSSIHLSSLKSLTLSGCSKFKKFPEISEVVANLSELYLDGTAIKELPSSIRNLTGLVTLNLEYCKELQSLPSSIFQMKLLNLSLFGCTKLGGKS